MSDNKGLLARAFDLIQKEWNSGMQRPLSISVMGQAGVGKTSLINALFGTDFMIDPIRPATTEIQSHSETTQSGQKVEFYDLPGIGESQSADKERIEQYKKHLQNSDVVIWAIQADSRSYVFDSDTLKEMLDSVPDHDQQADLMSKIVFVLNKIDLLTSEKEPSPWILAKEGDKGVFKPQQPIKELIEKKEEYFRKAFINGFSDLIMGQTYCNSNFNIGRHPNIYRENKRIYYRGLFSKDEKEILKQSFPQYREVFDRLYDSYRIIPCSGRFRYNLNLLMRVIVDRLPSKSVEVFSKFVTADILSHTSFSKAKQYRNIMLLDEKKGISLDIANLDF